MATSTFTINWTTIIATFTALAGVAGSILTPIFGTHLAIEIQSILQGLAAVLVVLPAAHATAVVAATAKVKAINKANAAARLAAP